MQAEAVPPDAMAGCLREALEDRIPAEVLDRAETDEETDRRRLTEVLDGLLPSRAARGAHEPARRPPRARPRRPRHPPAPRAAGRAPRRLSPMCRGQAPPARRRARGQGRARRRRDLALPPLRLEGRAARRRETGAATASDQRAGPGRCRRRRTGPPATGLSDAADGRLWSRSRPIDPGTVGGRLPRAAAAAPCRTRRATCGWHPDVLHWPSGCVGPALVALVTDAVTGAPMTLHRTFLRPDGSGKADRSPSPACTCHGTDKRGGVVRLWPDEEVTYRPVRGRGHRDVPHRRARLRPRLGLPGRRPTSPACRCCPASRP